MRGSTTPVRLLLGCAVLTMSTCVDAPAAPEGAALLAPFTVAPQLALVGPTGEPARTAAQVDALNAAFDQVDRFRMVVIRAATGETVVDTVLAVQPGQDSYDLSVTIDLASTAEQFHVRLTALRGATVLFDAEPVTVTATPGSGDGSGGAQPTTNVTMRYSGPGVDAVSLQVLPTALVLEPGGSGALSATVQDASGQSVEGVPLAWSVTAGGVAEVEEGAVRGVGDGAVEVIVSTPSGLEARAWVYVVDGELAFAQSGVVRVRSAAGGEAAPRSTHPGAGRPAWSPDGERLFYAAEGRVYRAGSEAVLAEGDWPAVSPDGTKLALEVGGRVVFTNDDGSHPTEGPGGTTPIWADGATLLVGGGSVQRVRADGSGRVNVVSGDAGLAALGPSGRIAYIANGDLRLAGSEAVLFEGARGRPTWSPGGRWLVVPAPDGLALVAADGDAPPTLLPGIGAGATDPAFRPSTPLAPVPGVEVRALDPDPPVPGEPVTLVGSGFDWIIPSNNVVTWPTGEGREESEVSSVTEDALVSTMPRSVVDGQIRVETRGGSGVLAFTPAFAAIEVVAKTHFGKPVSGVRVAVRKDDGTDVGDGVTDALGRALITGLLPGTYAAALAAPEGFSLQGETIRSLTLATETARINALLLEHVREVHTEPAKITVEVGSSTDVRLFPIGFRGDTLEELVESRWVGAAPHVSAGGEGRSGRVVGVVPSDAEGAAAVVVRLNGDVFEIPVSVTSYVEGTVVQDPDPDPGPQGSSTGLAGDAGPAAAAAATEPSINTEVKVLQDGTLVATARTDGAGRYRAGGLFAGRFDVTIDPVGERSPVPDFQTVVLDEDHPTGKADFLMSLAPVESVEVAAEPALLEALDATTTVTVTPRDSLGRVLAGRRVLFTSSDPTVATVDADGVVTAVDNGIATIEVTVEEVRASLDITVDQRAVTLTLVADPASGEPERDSVIAFEADTATAHWDARDANGHPVLHKTPAFQSSDPAVAVVDAAGFVQVGLIGFADITALLDDGADTVTLDVRRELVGDLLVAGPADLADAAANRYGRVTGRVSVQATSLTDLAGLETLLDIGGDLTIVANPLLVDLSALGGVRYVGGSFIVEDNDALLTPNGLALSVERVDGSVQVVGNAAVTNLDLFGRVQSIGGRLQIGDNAQLAHLDGFSELTAVAGDVDLFNNPNLRSFSNLPALIAVGGGLFLYEAGAEVGFPALAGVEGPVTVGGGEGNDLVIEVLRMPALTCVGGRIDVFGVEALTSADLSALATVGIPCGFSPAAAASASGPVPPRRGEPLLEGDGATPGARAVQREIRARAQRMVEKRVERLRAESERHRALRSALEERYARARRDRLSAELERALSAGAGGSGPAAAARAERARRRLEQRLETREGPRPAVRRAGRRPASASFAYGGGFVLGYNPVLTSIDLSSLVDVQGGFNVVGNAQLGALDLPALENVGAEFCLEATGVTALSAPLLSALGGPFCLWSNPALASAELPALSFIDGALDVEDNDALAALSLPALEWVTFGVDIDYNDVLPSLELPAFRGQDADGGDFDVHENAALQYVEVGPSAPVDFGGSINIYRNDALSSVSLPGLASTFDDCSIFDNPNLVSIVLATLGPADVGWDLEILDNAALRFFDAPGVRTTSDDVWLEDNPVLERIDLSGLESIGDDLALYGNGQSGTALEADFSRLSATDDDVDVAGNPGLTHLDLSALDDVGDDLWVIDNLTLTTLTLTALSSVSDWFEVDGNPALASFDVPVLTHVGGDFEVDDLDGLTTFSAPSLLGVGGDVLVDLNPVLTGFDLGSLRTVGGPPYYGLVEITNNAALTGFDLGGLQNASRVSVVEADALTTLPDLGSLAPGTDVTIQGNDNLKDLAGLRGSTALHTLLVADNPSLTDISGLSTLTNAADVQFLNDDALTVATMSGLTTLTGSLSLIGMDGLTGASFPNLTGIGPGGVVPNAGGGALTVSDVPALNSLSIPKLTHLDGYLSVHSTGLSSLDGIRFIATGIWSVSVQNNPVLADVYGLGNIGTLYATPAVGGTFTVSGNGSLSDCDVQDVVGLIDARNPGAAFGGAIAVANAPCSQ